MDDRADYPKINQIADISGQGPPGLMPPRNGPVGSLHLLRRLLRRFRKLPFARRLLICEAVTGLAMARLALVFVPFPFLAARFGRMTAPGADSPIQVDELPHAQMETAREIGWAITRAARYVPFHAVCLPQAIAAKAMLGRRHIASVMHFGVARGPGEPLTAHAWLNAGDIEVTGYPVAAQFVEMARFQ